VDTIVLISGRVEWYNTITMQQYIRIRDEKSRTVGVERGGKKILNGG